MGLMAGRGMTGGDQLTECVVDGQPADGAWLCGECVRTLSARLGHVPSLVEELEVTVTRQDKLTANRTGAAGHDKPLAFNERASAARLHLRDILGLWCRDVADHGGLTLPSDATDVTVAAALWLTQHPGAVRHHPAAAELFEEVSEAVRLAFAAIDRPPDALFAGRCECGGLLYAWPGREWVPCRACGLEYHAQDRRDWMLVQLANHEGTAAEVSLVLAAVGVRVSRNTITKWASRAKLGRVDGGRYRVGDVVAVAAGREAA